MMERKNFGRNVTGTAKSKGQVISSRYLKSVDGRAPKICNENNQGTSGSKLCVEHSILPEHRRKLDFLSSTPCESGAEGMTVSSDVSSISCADHFEQITEEAAGDAGPVIDPEGHERETHRNAFKRKELTKPGLLILYTKYIQAEFLKAKTIAIMKDRDRISLEAYSRLCSSNKTMKSRNDLLRAEITELQHRIKVQEELKKQKEFLEETLPSIRKASQEMALLTSTVENKLSQLPTKGLKVPGDLEHIKETSARLSEMCGGSQISSSVQESGYQILEDLDKTSSLLCNTLEEESQEVERTKKVLQKNVSVSLQEASEKFLNMNLEEALET